jgi:hypothetical protein
MFIIDEALLIGSYADGWVESFGGFPFLHFTAVDADDQAVALIAVRCAHVFLPYHCI